MDLKDRKLLEALNGEKLDNFHVWQNQFSGDISIRRKSPPGSLDRLPWLVKIPLIVLIPVGVFRLTVYLLERFGS